MLKNKLLFIALFTLFIYPVLADENSDISINDAWISEAPPTVSILAAYAHIHNSSSEPRTLVSVTSSAFSSVELHLSKVINETATMEEQEVLTVPANSSIELTPGGYHLMLIEPKNIFKAGDIIMLDFRFADGSLISVSATVKKRNSSSHTHEHHHHH